MSSLIDPDFDPKPSPFTIEVQRFTERPLSERNAPLSGLSLPLTDERTMPSDRDRTTSR